MANFSCFSKFIILLACQLILPTSCAKITNPELPHDTLGQVEQAATNDDVPSETDVLPNQFKSSMAETVNSIPKSNTEEATEAKVNQGYNTDAGVLTDPYVPDNGVAKPSVIEEKDKLEKTIPGNTTSKLQLENHIERTYGREDKTAQETGESGIRPSFTEPKGILINTVDDPVKAAETGDITEGADLIKEKTEDQVDLTNLNSVKVSPDGNYLKDINPDVLQTDKDTDHKLDSEPFNLNSEMNNLHNTGNVGLETPYKTENDLNMKETETVDHNDQDLLDDAKINVEITNTLDKMKTNEDIEKEDDGDLFDEDEDYYYDDDNEDEFGKKVEEYDDDGQEDFDYDEDDDFFDDDDDEYDDEEDEDFDDDDGYDDEEDEDFDDDADEDKNIDFSDLFSDRIEQIEKDDKVTIDDLENDVDFWDKFDDEDEEEYDDLAPGEEPLSNDLDDKDNEGTAKDMFESAHLFDSNIGVLGGAKMNKGAATGWDKVDSDQRVAEESEERGLISSYSLIMLVCIVLVVFVGYCVINKRHKVEKYIYSFGVQKPAGPRQRAHSSEYKTLVDHEYA